MEMFDGLISTTIKPDGTVEEKRETQSLINLVAIGGSTGIQFSSQMTQVVRQKPKLTPRFLTTLDWVSSTK
jgi:hypothetical protein